MKTSIYIILLMALSVQLSAQNTVITLRGDTLAGTFSLAKRGGNEFVDFVDKNGKKKKFKLFDIKRIISADDEIIEPINIGDGEYTFGKLMSEGYLSLYNYRGQNSTITFNEKIMIKLDGTSLPVPGAFGFRKSVSKFLFECPEVSQKVNNKKLSGDNLDQILTEFNTCIAVKSASNVNSTGSSAPRPPAIVTDELQTQIDDFKTLLKYSDKVENKEDVSDMFSDLTKKLASKEKVPNYLKNILMGAVANDNKLKALLETMLK